MMVRFPALFTKRLEQKRSEHSFRVLGPRLGVDFSSNDYLGFAEDEVLRSRIFSDQSRVLDVGSTASRLLRGSFDAFSPVEKQLAAFCGAEDALIFPSGYQCNIGVLSALASPGDLVFSDYLNHASLIDGIRLSGAQKLIYPHNHLEGLRQLLNENRTFSGLKFIVTESIFSMDGDLAPLTELAALAVEYGAFLIVDEAHATGLWGSDGCGGGRVQELGLRDQVLATIHSGGKSLGVGGAWVCGSTELKSYLVNFARPFIFSTAPPPILVHSLGEAVRFWTEVGSQRAAELKKKSSYFRELLTQPQYGKLKLPDLPGPIWPIVIGENLLSLETARNIQAEGFDVRAIRPPTVPPRSSRLRVALHWGNSTADLEKLAESILRHLPLPRRSLGLAEVRESRSVGAVLGPESL